MRAIPVAILLLAFASPAFAQELDGVVLGMTRAQALQVMGASVGEVVVPGGVRMDFRHPDGAMTTVGVCTADHSNQVNSVNHFQPGSIDDFGRKVDELSAELGTPAFAMTPAQAGQPRRIGATWSRAGVTWSVQVWGLGAGLALGQFIYKPCGAAG